MKKIFTLLILFLILMISSCTCSGNGAIRQYIKFGENYEVEDNIFIMVNNNTYLERFEISCSNKSVDVDEYNFIVSIRSLNSSEEDFYWNNVELGNLPVNISSSNSEKAYWDESSIYFVVRGSETIYISYREASDNVKDLIKAYNCEFAMECSNNIWYFCK